MVDNNNDNSTNATDAGSTCSKKTASVSRSSSFNTKAAVMENPTKIQAIVFTNTDDLDNLNLISNDAIESPAILYENDFDLYSVLKEMIKIPQQKTKQIAAVETSTAANEQMSQAKKKVIYKNYKKLLTAQLNDINYTDGKDKWLLHNNFNLMYSKNIKCIGTNPIDFVHSESIFLDLQPLSTRIKLMCKLVIIIQGACVERFGPPKLVQDRCMQFDGDHDLKPKDTTNTNNYDSNTNINKIKSNSCENLLLETSSTTTTTTTTTLTSSTTDDAIMISNSTNNENILYRRKRQDSAPNIIEKALKESRDDEEVDAKNYSKKHYDLENYYRHRMSRYSLKDYASLPYYQYSRRIVKRFDKAINTDDSFLSDLKEQAKTIKILNQEETANFQTTESSSKTEIINENTTTTTTTTTTSKTSEAANSNKKDCATCTSDLIDDFKMGYYSKSQLLSEYSLYNTKSSLWNSFTNTEASYDDNKEMKTEYYYSYSKEYFVTSKGTAVPPPTHISGLTIETHDFSPMRLRPQKSSNWSLFNHNRSSTERITTEAFEPISQQQNDFRFSQTTKFNQQAPPPIPPRATTSNFTLFKPAKF